MSAADLEPDAGSETQSGIAGWSLRLRIFLFFALIALGGVLCVCVAAWLGWRRLDPEAPAAAFMFGGVLACLGLLALTTWVWFLFDENVAKPLTALAGDLRSRAHANVAEKIDPTKARYLGDIGPAAAAVSHHLADSRSGLDAAIERARERTRAEHARLDAILRDTPTGCLLCSRSHRIALYNQAAFDQLRDLGPDFGLGRSVLDVFRAEPILDALERLSRRNDDSATELLCTTRQGARTFQAEMRLYAADGESGYHFTFRDVTQAFAERGHRETLLSDVFERLQRPAANLLTTIEALGTPAGAEPAARAQLQASVVAETRTLATAVNALRARYETGADGLWPMAETPLGDLLTSVQARLAQEGLAVDVDATPLTARCDGFALTRLLSTLALDARRRCAAQDFRLRAAEDAVGGRIDIEWRGAAFPVGALERRLDAPLGDEYDRLTARDALRSHRTDMWPETAADGVSRLSLPLPGASRAEAPLRQRRRVFHDLRLLTDPDNADRRALRSLDYVVFDTETTGLNPEKDEIVQIAAVRIVRGRLLVDDVFDTLVDPQRSIPPSATEIHRITPEMVSGAPLIDEAGRRFHQFCGDSVLIAHNAPFDLGFLRRHADRIGLEFEHPVLDTALMSAILFGREADPSLDAIAGRLGLQIDAAARHTAIGDAVATAEIASKMIAMLDGVGIGTLESYRRAAEPHRAMLGF